MRTGSDTNWKTTSPSGSWARCTTGGSKHDLKKTARRVNARSNCVSSTVPLLSLSG